MKQFNCLVVLIIIAWSLTPGFARAETATPTPPTMPPMPDRLAPPPTEYPPNQASQGAQVYYQVCMACHGDRGQGLTDEWRGVLDVEDQNCWQSGCHNIKTQPGGFIFPKYVPPVVGSPVLARFRTALDLYQFVQEKMPFQAPGSLSDAEYWQLTAYILRLNDIEPGPSELDAGRAAHIPLAPWSFTTQTPTPAQAATNLSPTGLPGAWLGVAIAAISLLGIGFLLVKYRR